LSYRNLQANAESIAGYLGIGPDERPITTLSMAYSYGLSVINSHLLAGAAIVLTDQSVTQREFWSLCTSQGATSIAGVPYTYEMLLRWRLLDRDIPKLRTMTQAGGRLSLPLTQQLIDISERWARRFFVMYGQTEATARIAYLPHDHAREKMGAIGVAVPGGTIRVDSDNGELIYTGPNVMMGYCESVDDLARGDDLHGVLRTGDLARVDEDGFCYITGRIKRFIKIFGQRFSLDHAEDLLAQSTGAVVCCIGSDDHLTVLTPDREKCAEIERAIVSLFKLHHTAFRVAPIAEIPYLASGKKNYMALTANADAHFANG
jgi:acyl-CoA synthetase (AMP-forming)/AMP-acid ligase II